MNHTECREAIALDEVEQATRLHLDKCEACRSFADDLRRLEQLAVELAPPAPADIADRVLARLDGTAASRAKVVPLRRGEAQAGGWRVASRSLSVRLTSAAAVIVLIAAVVTGIVENQPQDPADVVLASAQSAADAGTADVRISATTDVVLTAPPPRAPGALPQAPNFAGAPVELRAQMEAQWQQAMAEFEVQLQHFFDEVDRSIGAGTQQMDAAMRQMQRQFEDSLRQFGRGPGFRPSPPPPPQRPQRPRPDVRPPAARPQPPAPPTEVHARVLVTGRGTVDFAGQRLALRGAVSTAGGRAPFAVAAAADAAVYRSGGRSWTELPGRAGPLGAIVLDPEAILQVAQAATNVTAEGTASLNGVTVDRYTFSVDVEGDGRTEPWAAEAFVDADGRLRRVDMTVREQAGGGGHGVATRVTMDLSGFGEAKATGPLPDAAQGTALPQRSSLPLYPFNTSVRAAQRRQQ